MLGTEEVGGGEIKRPVKLALPSGHSQSNKGDKL